MSNPQCQICQNTETEDVCIIQEMLTQFSQSQADPQLSIDTLTNIFKHIKFRKCLAAVFDQKYLEICDKCTHTKLLNIFIPLWKAQHNKDSEPVDAGLDSLYMVVLEKQEKLKRSKEHFDQLAQSLFNCDDNGSVHSFESSSNNEEIKMNDDVAGDPPAMQFNKNSNKNKFQKRSIDILKKWFLDHLENPYPDTAEKMRLSTTTGMHVRQIQNWFTNSRKRYLEPLKKKFDSRGRNVNDSSDEQQLKKKIKRAKDDDSDSSSEDSSPKQKQVKKQFIKSEANNEPEQQQQQMLEKQHFQQIQQIKAQSPPQQMQYPQQPYQQPYQFPQPPPQQQQWIPQMPPSYMPTQPPYQQFQSPYSQNPYQQYPAMDMQQFQLFQQMQMQMFPMMSYMPQQFAQMNPNNQQMMQYPQMQGNFSQQPPIPHQPNQMSNTNKVTKQSKNNK